MSANQVTKAANRTLALTYKDGLFDILLGGFFVLLAIQEPLEQQGYAVWVSYLPALITMAVGLPIYAILKRRVVTPRIGVAKISVRHNPQRRTLLLLAVGLQLVTLLIFVLAANGWLGNILPAKAGWVIDAFFGVAIFSFFAFMGYIAEAPRFYLYGLLLGGTALSKVFWRPENPWLDNSTVLLAGAVMVICGIAALVSFLRDYPVVEMEETNE
jgi:hypothetical protein